MDITLLSTRYEVREITDRDIPDVLALCEGNPIYYEYCPPWPDAESIRADIASLPPGKTAEDKHYVGFYKNRGLSAVMDLICGYPDDESAFIGFFMLDRAAQGKGIGTFIVTECLHYLSSAEYKKVKLGYMKGNPQAKTFWEKNRFSPDGAEIVRENGIVVVMERIL